MSLFLHFILSFFGAIGFSVIFNVPRKSLFYCGLCGAIGWTLYKILTNLGGSPVNANLIAAICVAAVGEVLARINKTPVTVFVIPGIICLVPGYGVYRTMFSLIQDDFTNGLEIGFQTLFSAGAIATGVILVSTIARILKSFKKSSSVR